MTTKDLEIVCGGERKFLHLVLPNSGGDVNCIQSDPTSNWTRLAAGVACTGLCCTQAMCRVTLCGRGAARDGSGWKRVVGDGSGRRTLSETLLGCCAFHYDVRGYNLLVLVKTSQSRVSSNRERT
ncbi:hypothetical protein PR048_005218 [Dryococelus australis]|uniref:Uncharacterized protein n=1 Tax=Dryococelus australis TaxID=614101 RepID=A0ABQ9I7K5_9NEOP|nr:hypothetical protein PR048_005218 [Dryococelus australis]